MALKLKGIPNWLFPQARADDEGIGQRKTRIVNLAFPGFQFTAQNPDTDAVTVRVNYSSIMAQADNLILYCPFHLPLGATIIEVVVFGANPTKKWHFFRVNVKTEGSTTLLLNINLNTSKKVSYVVTDINSAYHFMVDNVDTNNRIFGARVTYMI